MVAGGGGSVEAGDAIPGEEDIMAGTVKTTAAVIPLEEVNLEEVLLQEVLLAVDSEEDLVSLRLLILTSEGVEAVDVSIAEAAKVQARRERLRNPWTLSRSQPLRTSRKLRHSSSVSLSRELVKLSPVSSSRLE